MNFPLFEIYKQLPGSFQLRCWLATGLEQWRLVTHFFFVDSGVWTEGFLENSGVRQIRRSPWIWVKRDFEGQSTDHHHRRCRCRWWTIKGGNYEFIQTSNASTNANYYGIDVDSPVVFPVADDVVVLLIAPQDGKGWNPIILCAVQMVWSINFLTPS
ncbi:hypothetical protein MRB53_012616 [Persea americana]|uniref:Uncharacterized protein n=1 Tax=Persea americana TaxID=3435 RepID=A0ACC2LY30_PERAE|nr:hypothetical protein MRB53_012616 [Persea americana]